MDQGNQPKTSTVLIAISSFFIMLFVLNLINTYEQTIIEAKNKHFGGRVHEVVDFDEIKFKKINSENNIAQTSEDLPQQDPDTFEEDVWVFLHTMSLYSDPKPTQNQQQKAVLFLKLFGQYIHPYELNLLDFIEENPVQTTSSEALSEYLCKYHNKISELREDDSEIIECDKIGVRYGKDECDCDETDNDDENKKDEKDEKKKDKGFLDHDES